MKVADSVTNTIVMLWGLDRSVVDPVRAEDCCDDEDADVVDEEELLLNKLRVSIGETVFWL